MQDPIKLRTIFMGTSSFAAEILKSLLENKYNVISVYTRPDTKIGREQKEQKSDVKIVAEEAKLEVFEPFHFDKEEISRLKSQKPDLLIVAAYGKILPEEVLKIPGFGALNVHASLLPKFRGPSPVQNAILEGETETGTTIMLMDKGIDTGEILAQKEIAIHPKEKYPELLQKIAKESSKLLLETLSPWVKRKISPVKQDDSKASYCQLIEREDGKINWTDTAEDIFNKWRAFYPWPGIFTYFEKDGYNLRLKLHEIEFSPMTLDAPHSKGQVFSSDGKFFVCAGDGAIILKEVQLEGKSKVSIEDFLNGYPNFVNNFLK